jgi:hypothetical protein
MKTSKQIAAELPHNVAERRAPSAIAIRGGLYIPGVSPVIWDALARFVTVLCDGAFDTEGEHAHDDVIALAYVMPPWLTHDWGAWPKMIREWYEGGRAPKDLRQFWSRFGSDPEFAADLVASAVADAFEDGLLHFLGWDSETSSDVVDQSAFDCAIGLAALSLRHGERLRRLAVEGLAAAACELEMCDTPPPWRAA